VDIRLWAEIIAVLMRSLVQKPLKCLPLCQLNEKAGSRAWLVGASLQFRVETFESAQDASLDSQLLVQGQGHLVQGHGASLIA